MARATHFVSHAWKYPFNDLLTVLEAQVERDARNETAYFWIGASRSVGTRRSRLRFSHCGAAETRR